MLNTDSIVEIFLQVVFYENLMEEYIGLTHFFQKKKKEREAGLKYVGQKDFGVFETIGEC